VTLTPQEIEGHLLQHVIGQDEAIRRLAVAVAMHVSSWEYTGDQPLQKMNVVLVGPTGTGKTEMVSRMAEFLDVPYAAMPATAITAPGFAGFDPDQVLKKLITRSKDKKKAERGIIFIDEIDKIARKPSDEEEKSRGLTTGTTVQQTLLDIIGGEVIEILGQGSFDTRKVLFVFSGAFVGIERVISGRLASGSSAARPSIMERAAMLRRLEGRDLVAYGMIPEFVGRCPVLIPLRPLDPTEIVRILTEPKRAPARQMVVHFQLKGVRLELDNLWLGNIAREAVARDTGARALLGVLQDELAGAYRESAPGDVVIADGDGIRIEGVGKVLPASATDASTSVEAVRTAGSEERVPA
jgi:ATP-dependent Clp protease ATP-binding subunit ClpX